MIKRIAGIFLLGFFSLSPIWLVAQDSAAFSYDPALFVAELEVLLKQAPARHRQAAATLMSNIRQGFNTGLIGSDQQQTMITMANQMYTVGLKPFPHYFAYFSASMAFQEKYTSKEQFIDWNKSVSKLVSGRNEKSIQDFLEKSEVYFKEGVLFRSNSVQWRIFDSDWAMTSDSLPGFVFRDANLRCYANRDSMSILNASGSYYPVQNEWVGTKGRINWENSGYAADQVYADFTFYNILLTNSSFTADSALMHFPEYFNRALPGSVNHRVVAGGTQAAGTYPRFSSHNVFLEVRNIFQDIDYMGGFGLEGNRVVGFGKNRNNAVVTIRKSGEPIVKLESYSFIIRNDRITAQRAAFCLFLENDSIYHPGLQMRYLHSERELMLLRTGDGLAQSPYFNSYHQLDMIFEALYWKLDEDEMTFGAMLGLSRESEATFESDNFFTKQRFNSIQGADARHPLILINGFIQGLGSNVFYHEELATHLNLSITQVSAMLISLANRGFLQYSPDDGKVVVKDRTHHYIDAINDRSDYDVIRVQSKVEGLVNARLNLKTFDLDIFGVPEVYLSNTQKVFIYPGNQQIRLKKGMDFLFQGRINAGYFEFYAKECAFVYDEFKLNLTQIDSLSFQVPVQQDIKVFEEKLERVKTVISNISGDLLIDDPNNKSGRKSFPRYPIFDSKNDAYVYFDEPHIQGGVYQRDSFYYHVMPFTIDSLTNFTTVGMSFNGYLVSGNIFPNIEEPLRVQPDYSLGFTKQFSDTGLPIYNGTAKAFVDLSLSHQGLRGGGRVQFQTSVSHSEDFVFHPDKMIAQLGEFDLEEAIGVISNPAVVAKGVQQEWVPGEDVMHLRTIENVPFEMYNNQVVHKGTLIYSSDGLFGSGELTFGNAVFNSVDFNFQQSQFGADSSAFILKTTGADTAFRASAYDFQYDLELNQGRFSSKDTASMLEFPLNQYAGFMNSFRWEADYEEMFYSNEASLQEPFAPGEVFPDPSDLENSPVNFISLHPDQDSLRFAAGAARFDLREYLLEIQEVPFIEVADAIISPIDGKVGISRNAEMRPLQGANLVASKTNRNHSLYNATVVIIGRSDYSATGVYDYTDDFGKTQAVLFNRIAVDSVGSTYGLAHISDLGFSLSPFFDFIGNIRFDADKKEFYYDGGFRIRHVCSEINPHWIIFNGEVNKQNIFLPVADTLVDVHGEELSASVFFSLIDNKVYSGFLQGRQHLSDIPLFSRHGYISYDAESQNYHVGTITGDSVFDQSSGLLTLNVDRCILSGEGEITFGQNFERVSMFTAGKLNHYMLPDSTVFELFSVIDFFFSSDALEFLNQALTQANLTGLDPGNPLFSDGLRLMLGETDAQRLLSELNLYGTFRKFPKELSQTLILGDLNLKWNNTTRSFTSFGPIGIATLNNQLVNRYVDGHIELVRRRTGDALTIYLQPNANEWYFFSYTGGIMQAISSNEEFNNLVMNLKEDKRTLKTRGSDETYQFIISTTQERNAFLRRMRGN
ncbi:MAG: hypothetical protein IH597_06450 [Bacteroidales bacterium]|nr:hypothetical protein [Bacteroidales bacterium]